MSTRFWIVAALALWFAAPALADGDVVATVNVEKGVLKITGDAGDNNIEITPAGPSDAFTVTGKNGTTVNSLPAATFIGVRTLFIQTGSGADRVEVRGAAISADLRVHLQQGPDVLVLDEVRVRGVVGVKGGDGDDRIVAQHLCVFQKTVTVMGGRGRDSVEVLDSVCRDRIRIDSGVDSDNIVLDDSEFDEGAEIEARSGNDDLDVDDCEFSDNFDVDMGRGDDDVQLEDSDFDGDVDMTGGSGDHDELDFHGGNDFDDDNHVEWDSFEH